MKDYPAWDIDSGKTLADYNNERKTEANRRLSENTLPNDDDFINRNPVKINREIEKQIRKMVGHLDYIPMEANVVISGVILIE